MIKLLDILKEAEYKAAHNIALNQTEKDALELVDKFWDKFSGKDCNQGFCDIYAYKINKLLPGSKIWSTEEQNDTFGHVWVEYKGKFYDAEVSNGVNDWKQLPWMISFFKRNKHYPEDITKIK